MSCSVGVLKPIVRIFWIVDDRMLRSVFGRRRAGSAIQFGVFSANVGCAVDLFVGVIPAPASDDKYVLYRCVAVEYVGGNLKLDEL